jgi:hypothetical protein
VEGGGVNDILCFVSLVTGEGRLRVKKGQSVLKEGRGRVFLLRVVTCCRKPFHFQTRDRPFDRLSYRNIQYLARIGLYIQAAAGILKNPLQVGKHVFDVEDPKAGVRHGDSQDCLEAADSSCTLPQSSICAPRKSKHCLNSKTICISYLNTVTATMRWSRRVRLGKQG